MDIEKLLEEKKKKLEDLKKQRLEKQNDLITHFSTPDLNETKTGEEPHFDHQNDTENTENKYISESVSSELSTVEKEKTSNAFNIAITKPPPILYNKTTDTSDSNYDSQASNEEELTKKIHRELEKKIRLEMEQKYKSLYDKAVENFKESNETIKHEPVIHSDNTAIRKVLDYPKTKIKQISKSETNSSKILTLHDDCICIWELKDMVLYLDNCIYLYTKINIAIFDQKNSNKIIFGSDSGFIYIHDLIKNSQIRSKFQLNSIVSLYQTSETLIVLTIDASYAIVAMNLVDILNPLKNILESNDFKISKDSQLKEKDTVICTSIFLNANNAIIGLLTGEVISVDFGEQKLDVLYENEKVKLPAISFSYIQGKILILGLDHSIQILSVGTGLNFVDPINLPDLTFSVEWLTSSSFISCTIKNEFTIWEIKNDTIIKVKSLNIENDNNINFALISAIKSLDSSTLIYGDLKGSVKVLSLK